MATALPRMVLGKISDISTQQMGPMTIMKKAAYTMIDSTGSIPATHTVTQGDCKGSDSHTDGTDDKQRFPSETVDGENSYQCKDDIDNAHDDGLHHSSAFGTGIFEYSRRIIEHGVDADGLLEDRKQNTDNNHRRTVGEQLLCLFLRSGFYFGKNLLCFCGSIHFLRME